VNDVLTRAETTFGGHPVMAAIALKNIEVMKRDRIIEHAKENEGRFRDTLAQLLELPSSAICAASGTSTHSSW